MNVVPNPTSGAISLESNLPMDGTLQMVDLVGKVNCTMELKTPLLYINLDFSKLANGSYILIYKSINGTSKHIKFEIIK
ncbi:MAG: T9SS type A sorting domain-containing protein [Bacteroidetes bacterium]|nr:T9SS type A sorting domain-containing protein [Bacteroidota bacterium]